MHFDLADLRVFVQIAEAQNLTQGARRAHLSPASASARLKALEGRLGARLFYRDNRGVTLTAAGNTLLRHARVILRQVEHAKGEIAGQGADQAGHIRIYANTTAVTEFLPELLADFLAARPGVTVDLQERLMRDIVRGVQDGAVDFGIGAGHFAESGLQSLHFSTDRLVLVVPASHPLAARRRIALRDTLRYDHVGLYDSSSMQTFLREVVAREGGSMTVRIQLRSFDAMCRMIEAGVGVGVLPESAAVRHQRTMQLAVVQLSDAWAVRERSVLVRDLDALPSCARALVTQVLALGARSVDRRGPATVDP